MPGKPRIPDGVSRICTGCGCESPGLIPVGWVIEQDRKPIGPNRRMIVVGVRAYCLDCQHPELTDGRYR